MYSKTSQLSKYLSASAAFLGAGTAMGQGIYTDFNPDEELLINDANVYSSLQLDIDQDGTPDFLFYGAQSSSSYTTSWTSRTYIYTTSGTYTYTYTNVHNYWNKTKNWTLLGLHSDADVVTDGAHIVAFDSGDQIGQHTPHFFNGSDNIYHFYSSNYTSSNSGNWQTHIDGLFAGVRLTKNGQGYYGWIRIRMINEKKFIVKDMALGEPLMNIVAGDTTASGAITLNESISKDLELWTVDNHLLIENRSNRSYDLRVFSFDGKTMVDLEAIQEREKQLSTTHWKSGVYLVGIREENGRVWRRKILIQH
jgi:hypothetical protein